MIWFMGFVSIQIVVPPILEAGVGCWACRNFMEQAGVPLGSSVEDYPEELRMMALRLDQLLERIRCNSPQAIGVELVDALSPRGLWKQIRHGLRPLPGFLLNGRKLFCGWDLDEAEALIMERIGHLGRNCPSAPSLS